MISFRVTIVATTAALVAANKAIANAFPRDGDWLTTPLNADGDAKAATHYWASAMLDERQTEAVTKALAKVAGVKMYVSHPGGNTQAVASVVPKEAVAWDKSVTAILDTEKLAPKDSKVSQKAK